MKNYFKKSRKNLEINIFYVTFREFVWNDEEKRTLSPIHKDDQTEINVARDITPIITTAISSFSILPPNLDSSFVNFNSYLSR